MAKGELSYSFSHGIASGINYFRSTRSIIPAASKPAPPAPTLSLGGGGGGGKYIPPNQRGDAKRGERVGDSMSQSRVQGMEVSGDDPCLPGLIHH